MKRLFVVFVIGIAFAPSAAALTRGSVRGHVVSAGGEPLPLATLTLYTSSGERTQGSRSDGSFFFDAVEAGKVVVQAEADGFETVIHTGIGVDPARTTHLQISLAPHPDQTVTLTEEPGALDRTARGELLSLSNESLLLVPRREGTSALEEVPLLSLWSDGSPSPGLVRSKGSEATVIWLGEAPLTVTSLPFLRLALFDAFNLQQLTIVSSSLDPEMRTAGGQVLPMLPRREDELRASVQLFASIWSGDVGAPSGPSSPAVGSEGVLGGGAELGSDVISERAWLWGSIAALRSDLASPPLSGEDTSRSARLKLDVAGSSQWSASATALAAYGEVRLGEIAVDRSLSHLGLVHDFLPSSRSWLTTVLSSSEHSLDAADSADRYRADADETQLRVAGGLTAGSGSVHVVRFGASAGWNELDARARASVRRFGAYVSDTIVSNSVSLEGALLVEDQTLELGPRDPRGTRLLPRLGITVAPRGDASPIQLHARLARYSDGFDSTCLAVEAAICSGFFPAVEPGDGLRLPVTDELEIGWEHEITTGLVFGGRAAWRRTRDRLALVPAALPAQRHLLTNAPGEQNDDFIELHARRRFSSGFMFDAFAAWEDRQPDEIGEEYLLRRVGPELEGTRWSWAVTGGVQVPLVDVEIALALSGSEGEMWRQGALHEAAGATVALDDRFSADLRLARRLSLRVPLTAAVEMFNLTGHEALVAGEQPVLPLPDSAGAFAALQNPRSVRLSLRAEF